MRRVARSVAARALAGGFGTPSATPSARLGYASNPASLAAGASRASPPRPSGSGRPRDVWVRRLSDLRGPGARGEAPAPPSLKPTPKEAFLSALPGLGLAYGVAQGGFALADQISARSGVTVSGVPCAVVLGAALNNAPFSIPGVFRPGVKLASSAVLKLGIVCVGAKLSVPEVLSAGALSVPVVLASVGAGLFVIPKLAAFAGLAPRLGSLLAAGTSICGVTAVSALAPAISATQAEVSVAVANVVVWGTLGMLAIPHLARAAFGDVSEAAGAWLGVGVHDTAQVFGAGLTYQQRYGDERAFQVAAVTKLTRNALLAAAIPALVAANATGKGALAAFAAAATSPAKLRAATPAFLVAFLAASAVRSAGDVACDKGWVNDEAMKRAWVKATRFVGNEVGARHCLGTAMAAVGLGTSAAVVRGVGLAPFLVGGAGAATVGGVGFLGACALTMALPSARGEGEGEGEGEGGGGEPTREGR